MIERCKKRNDLQTPEEENQDLKIALFEITELLNSQSERSSLTGFKVDLSNILLRVKFLLPTKERYDKLQCIKYGEM